jgi:hypothetical protein
MTILREISRYRLDLVGAKVRWEGSGSEPAGECRLFYRMSNKNHELGRLLL